MLKHIYVSNQLDRQQPIDVVSVSVVPGARIRRGMVMMTLRQDGILVAIRADYDGWVRHVMVATSQSLAIGDLLLIVDVIDTMDYYVDPSELSVDTELGQNGRRGLERLGQKEFGDVARALFDAPNRETGEPGMYSGFDQHPLMRNMKEGVPPKESGIAANNTEARDEFMKEAQNSNELRLGQELQHRLALTAAPTLSTSPTPRPGG